MIDTVAGVAEDVGSAPRAVVVGSANVDLVYRVDHLPAPGETILAGGAARHPGGKGNNQVIAIARAGAPAGFVAAMGADGDGDELLAVLDAAGVTTRVRRVAEPTGTALIVVDDEAENTIVVNSGANATLTALDHDDVAMISGAQVLLLQLEVPDSVVLAAARAARAAGTTVVLNAAPYRPLPDDLIELLDLLIVNEVEAAAVGADVLARIGAHIVTLGAAGAEVRDRGHDPVTVPAPKVEAVDTTGAGDTFCGALVAGLCEGRDLVESARFAVAASALAVQRPGAVSSIPMRPEIDAALLDPLVPRPIDRPTVVALDGPPTALDDATRAALDPAKIFAAPDDPAEWPRWRERLHAWRDDARRRLDHDGAAYRDPATAWASSCFTAAITWLWDERLYDHDRSRFDVDGFLAAAADLGGFDAIVLWHAYPIIGIDERTQFDFYDDVPGLAELVAELQRRGLHVFFDYNPWDTEVTETGGGAGELDHATAMAVAVARFGADGVFLDTMTAGNAELVRALRDRVPPAVLEGESRVSLERISDHQISWAQWFADSPVPGVLRAHWFERGHMMHHTRRWNRDHSDELQSSWMNGTGLVVWDAVFGSWVGWNARDRATLRAALRVQRPLAATLRHGDWTPLVETAPAAHSHGVYASRWEHGSVTLWTLVNRATEDFHGEVLDLSASSSRPEDQNAEHRWFDVVGGSEIRPGQPLTVAARGIGGIVRCLAHDTAALGVITELVAAAAADPHTSDTTFPARRRVRTAAPRSTAAAPADAIAVAAGRYSLTVTSRRRETALYGDAPWVEEWKPLPPRLHADVSETFDVELGHVAVAVAEVTAAELAEYRAAVGASTGGSPASDDEPATGVGLAEARAYAAWRGARLPTEFEWQVAAGSAGFRRGRPEVWNWTESEHRDGATRFVILKGGSAYAPTASDWYFDGGVRDPSFSAKFLIPGGGLDASSRIGFRLAWDVGDVPRSAS